MRYIYIYTREMEIVLFADAATHCLFCYSPMAIVLHCVNLDGSIAIRRHSLYHSCYDPPADTGSLDGSQ